LLSEVKENGKSFCGADLPEPLNTTENLLKNKKLR